MALSDRVAERLRAQIQGGVYAFRGFPADKELAAQLGVSYMTARRVVQMLVDERLLRRADNGRAEIVPHGDAEHADRPFRLALLVPAFVSSVFDRWRVAVERTIGGLPDVSVRPFIYTHWDDPLLWDALSGFDGAFLIPPPDPLSDALAERLRAAARPPVVLGDDFTDRGLPSIVLYMPAAIQCVLDHLAERGHRRIDCFNIQPMTPDTQIRIGQWRLWTAARGLAGTLHNYPVEPNESPYAPAIARFRECLANGFDASAVFCVTMPAAMGVYRGLRDIAREPGTDVAVAVVDDEGAGAALAPSLTSVETPDPVPFLRVGLDWMRSRAPWTGPLLLCPPNPSLRVRESTAPLSVSADVGTTA